MLLNVKTSSGNYDIVIEKGAFDNLSKHISDVSTGKLFVVTDENVNEIYREKLEEQLSGFEFECMVLPSGEKTKCLDVLGKIYSAMAGAKITRSDTVVAFGGGVIGDITGLAAATYLRGVNFIGIPTTLLSQVDSSVGGKVAIDLPEGKNLVGSFYPPKKVVVDTNFLKTLPQRVFNDGMAEVIKYACIRDEKLFDMLGGNAEDCIDEIVYKCLDIKRQIVEADEFDKGERMILNFGHTFGHAVEKMYNYETYTHGEAVAIGMSKITHATENMKYTESGTAEKLDKLLKKYDLLFDSFEFDADKAMEIICLDKKGDGNSINYIFIKSIGVCEIVKKSKNDKFIVEQRV